MTPGSAPAATASDLVAQAVLSTGNNEHEVDKDPFRRRQRGCSPSASIVEHPGQDNQDNWWTAGDHQDVLVSTRDLGETVSLSEGGGPLIGGAIRRGLFKVEGEFRPCSVKLIPVSRGDSQIASQVVREARRWIARCGGEARAFALRRTVATTVLALPAYRSTLGALVRDREHSLVEQVASDWRMLAKLGHWSQQLVKDMAALHNADIAHVCLGPETVWVDADGGLHVGDFMGKIRTLRLLESGCMREGVLDPELAMWYPPEVHRGTMQVSSGASTSGIVGAGGGAAPHASGGGSAATEGAAFCGTGGAKAAMGSGASGATSKLDWQRVDAWQLGIVLFFFCTGEHPFGDRGSPASVCRNVRADKWVNRPLLEALPLHTDLVRRLLEYQPELRLLPSQALKHPLLWTESDAAAFAAPLLSAKPGGARELHGQAATTEDLDVQQPAVPELQQASPPLRMAGVPDWLLHLPSLAAYGPTARPKALNMDVLASFCNKALNVDNVPPMPSHAEIGALVAERSGASSSGTDELPNGAAAVAATSAPLSPPVSKNSKNVSPCGLLQLAGAHRPAEQHTAVHGSPSSAPPQFDLSRSPPPVPNLSAAQSGAAPETPAKALDQRKIVVPEQETPLGPDGASVLLSTGAVPLPPGLEHVAPASVGCHSVSTSPVSAVAAAAAAADCKRIDIRQPLAFADALGLLATTPPHPMPPVAPVSSMPQPPIPPLPQACHPHPAPLIPSPIGHGVPAWPPVAHPPLPVGFGLGFSLGLGLAASSAGLGALSPGISGAPTSAFVDPYQWFWQQQTLLRQQQQQHILGQVDHPLAGTSQTAVPQDTVQQWQQQQLQLQQQHQQHLLQHQLLQEQIQPDTATERQELRALLAKAMQKQVSGSASACSSGDVGPVELPVNAPYAPCDSACSDGALMLDASASQQGHHVRDGLPGAPKEHLLRNVEAKLDRLLQIFHEDGHGSTGAATVPFAGTSPAAPAEAADAAGGPSAPVFPFNPHVDGERLLPAELLTALGCAAPKKTCRI